jgi:acyl phosphate:glycerol-3-phosphate acyltransferase
VGEDAALVAAGGAILDHMFPIWLRFHGGKGVATPLGVLIALAWPVALAAGIGLLTILRHHANIRRLIAGTESRISLTKD